MYPITKFSSIEVDKENIKPIPQGRSVAKLNDLIHTDNQTLQKQLLLQRTEFENSLNPDLLQDLDDPLDSYLQYIKWIRENYRTGNNNESLLVQVLERTTHDFKDDPYYKNEIRYFKVWLEYITYSDHPGDVFSYLLKKKIGSDLSLFYEEYSLFFELNDQWDNAQSILKLGISNNARPQKRLLKSYEQFMSRKLSKRSKVQSPVKGLLNPNGTGLTSIPVHSTSTTRKDNKKFQIYQDTSSAVQNGLFDSSNKLKTDISIHLDTIKNSKKENILTSTSFAGRTLNTACKNEKRDRKVEVFQDKSVQYPITKTIQHPNGKKIETYDYNFELFMPTEKLNSTRSMLEVLLMFQKPIQNSSNEDTTHATSNKRLSSTLYNTPVNKKIKTDTNVLSDSPGIEDTPLLEYFKNSNGLFSSNYENEKDKNNTVKNEDLDEHYKRNSHQELPLAHVENSIVAPSEENKLLDAIISGAFSDAYTETITKPTTPKKPQKDFKNDENINNDLLSSPFVENPDKDVPVYDNELNLNPEDLPSSSDPKFKSVFYKKVQKSHFKQLNFHLYSNVSMNKLHTLHSIFKSHANPIYGNKQAIVEFEGEKLYCITKELGRSKNSTVYLSESMDGQLNAIKIQSPPDIWESYILSKLNKNSNKFVQIHSFYQFKDESYLVLPYFKQGSISDLIDCLTKFQLLTSKNLLEETFIIYLSIQLLSNILKLHSLDIVHCDINIDNFMLNIDTSNSSKLSFEDLLLVDFAKSIDLSLYPANTKFHGNFSKNNEYNEYIDSTSFCHERDYLGIADIIHRLLFNRSLKIRNSNGTKELVEPIKKYWQTDLWNPLFNLLLNSSSLKSIADVNSELQKIKSKFEAWFNLTVDKRLFANKLRNISEIMETRFKKVK